MWALVMLIVSVWISFGLDVWKFHWIPRGGLPAEKLLRGVVHPESPYWLLGDSDAKIQGGLGLAVWLVLWLVSGIGVGMALYYLRYVMF